MEDSILKCVKKVLGVADDYKAFDLDITMHINTVLNTLTDLGVGPPDGFAIEDDTATWTDFIGTDKRFYSVKSYTYLKVRKLFDPPTSSFLLAAVDEQIKELEWRINVYREELSWTDPNTPTTLMP